MEWSEREGKRENKSGQGGQEEKEGKGDPKTKQNMCTDTSRTVAKLTSQANEKRQQPVR